MVERAPAEGHCGVVHGIADHKYTTALQQGRDTLTSFWAAAACLVDASAASLATTSLGFWARALAAACFGNNLLV